VLVGVAVAVGAAGAWVVQPAAMRKMQARPAKMYMHVNFMETLP
jgi:hypothetical protein